MKYIENILPDSNKMQIYDLVLYELYAQAVEVAHLAIFLHLEQWIRFEMFHQQQMRNQILHL